MRRAWTATLSFPELLPWGEDREWAPAPRLQITGTQPAGREEAMSSPQTAAGLD